MSRRVSFVLGALVGVLIVIVEPRGLRRIAEDLRARLQHARPFE